MSTWNDFYVAVVGASAALTGLIFVGISINLAKILSIHGLPDRALLSLILLLNVTVSGLLFLIPEQATRTLGIEVLVIGLLAWLMIIRLDLRILKNKEKQYRRPYVFNFLINQISSVLFIITGLALLRGCANGEYWIVPAIILSIVKAVIDGWVLLVEINR